jgi:hypothetical protein
VHLGAIATERLVVPYIKTLPTGGLRNPYPRHIPDARDVLAVDPDTHEPLMLLQTLRHMNTTSISRLCSLVLPAGIRPPDTGACRHAQAIGELRLVILDVANVDDLVL